jgi:hypothetical protein
MPDITEDEFNDRMDRAFDPLNHRSLIESADLNLGGDGVGADAAVMAQIEALLNGDDSLVIFPPQGFTEDELAAARAESPATPVTRAYTSRYDREFRKRVALDEEIAKLDPTAPRYHEAMADLAQTRDRMKTELERSTDDQFRERERIDEWKMTVGKDERNASRRSRPTANEMTPKEILAAETPTERKDRIRKRDSELKRQKRAAARQSLSQTGLRERGD